MSQNAQIRSQKPRPRRTAPRLERNVVWLASFPKSGNTWARVFLANYLLNARVPLPINQVHRFGIGDSVSGAYRIVAGGRYDPADTLGHLRMREKVLRSIVANRADINFVKTHNARGRAFGIEMIPARYSRAAVYILRNPLDVAVSYARHFGTTPGEAARAISRSDLTTAADPTTVAQYLGDWSDHVRGWTAARDFPVHVMRYEDMKADPHAAFGALLEFLRVPVDAERLARSVQHASFDEMKRQESKTPFIERSANLERFFHTGETGQWEGALSPDDVEFLRQRHGEVMSRFGYL